MGGLFTLVLDLAMGFSQPYFSATFVAVNPLRKSAFIRFASTGIYNKWLCSDRYQSQELSRKHHTSNHATASRCVVLMSFPGMGCASCQITDMGLLPVWRR